jgi:hypothetical protein
LPRGRTNAVSDRFISAATAAIQASVGDAPASSRHTAAGFPVKGASANASTWNSPGITSLKRADERRWWAIR